MTSARTDVPNASKPLRLWPGVVAALLVVLARFVAPIVVPDGAVIGILGGVIGAALILLWWLLFSRAPWRERLGGLVLIFLAILALNPVVHPSISNGYMGRMIYVFSTPLFAIALVAAVAAARNRAATVRRAFIVAGTAVVFVVMILVRTEGVMGDGGAQLHWRWTPTPEQQLLASAPTPEVAPAPVRASDAAASAPTPLTPPADRPVATTPKATAPAAAEGGKASEKERDPVALPVKWAGFRGAARDNVIHRTRIETDWTQSPPRELWRQRIGPGWSSFAVAGDLIYTQEQRGEFEVVSCYSLETGLPVWRHRDPVRFYESNGGPGPRATPTVHDGRVYTMGATGIVNALHAATGAVMWSRNAETDTGAPRPGWGFTGSPVVADDTLIVAASGRLAAYDLATGNPRWTRATGGGGYSSPHLATIDGVRQILLLSGGGGATGVALRDGAVLWQHPWADGVSIVQPALIENGDLLVSGGDAMGGIGMRRLSLAQGPSGWTVEERWTTRGLKPYFNDFVVHEGHAYGFDGTILAAIDLASGERKWKGGRYGAGQMLLLADQDLLLVLSEEGELALVGATPDKHTEVAAKFKVIEGKTWNHPVLVGDTLLVRNGEEMAAFRLPMGR